MKKPPLQDVIVKSRDASHARRADFPPTSPDGGVRREERSVRSTSSFENKTQDGRREYEHEQLNTQQSPKKNEFSRKKRPLYPPKKRKWFMLALGVGFIVVLSSVALSLLFAGATVTVYPKQDTVVVNASFSTSEDASEGDIPIGRMAINKTAEREVIALGEEEVEERATGKVTLYNEYSDTPQRIIPRTRFESSSGLVYRVAEAVEIPGKKADGTPGSIEITITAEEPGEEHNIGPDTFTLPGYEEAGLTEHAEKIYAKSTGDMTGGFEGVRRSVDAQERAQVVEELQTELKDNLLSEAFTSAENPDGQRLFKDAVFFEFKTLSDELSGTDKVTIRVEGTLHAVLFPENELTKRLAQRTISSYEGSPIRIDNMDELTVSITPKESTEEGDIQESSEPWKANAYDASVQGKAHFIWEFDKNALAADFAGKKKEVLNMPFEGGILESYPGIDRLEVSIRPFWKSSFPEQPEDIHVITELDD